MLIPGPFRRIPWSCHPWLLLTMAFCLFAFSSFGAASSQESTRAPQSFDSIAAQADQARDADNLDQAVVLYRRALDMQPGWVEGWWSLGTILYDRDNYADSARAFQRVVALRPDHGSANVMLGLCEFELGQDDSALAHIQKGRQVGIFNNPQLARVMLYHEGLLLLRKGRFDDAQEALDVLSRDGGDDGELKLALGMSVLNIFPAKLPPEGSTAREVVTRVGTAEFLAATKKFDEARREYSAVADEFPETANIHYAFGRFLLDLGEVDPAVAAFKRQIHFSPGHVPARLQIGAAWYRVNSSGALKYAEEAVKLEPRRPFGHYLLGLLYLDTQNFTGAISELETAKRSYSTVPQLYFALGNAYARTGRKADAARVRAIFARLNAESDKETKAIYYGEKPSGLSERRLGSDTPQKAPE
jgi:tetratricopeptide (TPR) repeat protein